MDEALKEALSFYVMMFALGVVIVTSMLRHVVEFFLKRRPMPGFKYYWEELLLPILPFFVGGLAAWMMKNYPYPSLVKATGTRIFFGMVCGMFSGMFYRIIKSALAAKGGTGGESSVIEPTKPTESPKDG